ncbi:MAG: DUF2934 domain-containing protein [Phycisphaerae bacterium]|nr:DUF2934 domain-containing protein [Phycisphaerae bacterium]
MKIKPVGKAVGNWSDWKSPNDWKQEDILPSPGVYQLAVFRNEQQAKLYSPTTSNCHLLRKEPHYQGVVYIGKAICLQERYWLLVQSWCSGTSVPRHGSRKTYNQNHLEAKERFCPGEVRCRYKPLASMNWVEFREKLKLGLKPGASWQQQLHALWPDSGTLPKGLGEKQPNSDEDRLIQSAIATFSEEGNLLGAFNKIYGIPPLLNKRPPEYLGWSPNDAEMEEWLRKQIEEEDQIPDDHAIRLRAYEKWEKRRRPYGDDWTDWFDAELELWEHAILEG